MSSDTSTTPFSLAGRRVWVAGHGGMVGAALCRRLACEGCDVLIAGRDEADLTRQTPTEALMARLKPDVVFLAAARVGGILANDQVPADFLYDNLAIETNVIHAAFDAGATKLIMLGSSCIYPRLAPQPIAEDSLLSGPLEPTNQWYAIAKIAGVMMCDAYRRQHQVDFISVMPTNLYGPGDNFDLKKSHVAAALMVKMHLARQAGEASVTVWGSGTPRRELMHVDDAADAIVHVAKTFSGPGPVNIGTGTDVTIAELAATIARVTGYTGAFHFDTTRPDGTPRKLLDVSHLQALGWTSGIGLEEGLGQMYDWLLSHPECLPPVAMPAVQ